MGMILIGGAAVIWGGYYFGWMAIGAFVVCMGFGWFLVNIEKWRG